MDEQSLKQLAEFFKKYKRIEYKKREIIIRSGDIPSGVYFIESGHVREYSISHEGDEFTLFFSNPTDVFPVRWAFTNNVNTKNFEAYTPVVVWRAPQKDFLDFMKQNSDLLFSFTSYSQSRWNFFLDKTEQLVHGNASSKIAYILLMLLTRHGRKEDGVWTIPLQFTHKDLSTFMGSTRETVSIEMQKLIKKGVLTHDQQIVTIKDIEYLKTKSKIDWTPEHSL